ncbi:MAG: T9SS type A sorting domain-containing protein [Bacteroidales bacterium]|nr:T9SS type A sorting domain-containing protein [Bacteroidales bacterium]MDD4673523.1 T9SS type A sorting domain-containing protein [Bacteroidales bacterium]MDY0348554.1 T9SS type A sorting domain-containing protein [Tenuifilaceae bacterium]
MIITLNWFALLGQTSDGVDITKHNIGPYAQANASQEVWMVIENFSSSALTQFDVFCSVEGGNVYSQSFTDLDLGNWEPFLFNLNTPIAFSDADNITVKLWLDNINGTPLQEIDTLSIPVRVLSTTSDRMVLYESFSSSSCLTCVEANLQIRELANVYKEQMFVIGYQTDCFSGNPMCLLASEYINGRMDFYSIMSTPQSVVNPWYKGNSQKFDSNYIDAELQRPSPIEIEGTFAVSSSDIEVVFTLNPHADIDLNMVELKVAFTEDVVSFDEPPGGNGESTFYHVLRRFKTFSADYFKDIANANPVTISFTEDFAEIIPEVNLDEIRIGLFLQNTETTEVIQAAELSKTTSGIIPEITEKFKLYPNPSNGPITLEFTPTSTTYRIEISNNLGQNIYSSTIKTKEFEKTTANLLLHHLNPGIYFVSLIGLDSASTTKLILK